MRRAVGRCHRKAERNPKQSARVKELNPLAIDHVGLAAGYVADMAGIHQHNFQSTAVEKFEQRDPVYAGALHGYRLHPLFFKPVSKPEQFRGCCTEALHIRGSILPRRATNPMLTGTKINAGRIRIKGLQRPGKSFMPFALDIFASSGPFLSASLQ